MNSVYVHGDVSNSSIITGIGNISGYTYIVTIHDNFLGKVFIYIAQAEDHIKAKEQAWNSHIAGSMYGGGEMPNFTITNITDFIRDIGRSRYKAVLARVLYDLWEAE